MFENENLETEASIPSDDPNVRIGFILTREGRAWSDEGLLHATDMVNAAYPLDDPKPDDGVLWTMGMQINDPKFLASLLRVRPDAFVILSFPEKSTLIPNDDGVAGNDIADALDAADNGDRTSWSILASIWESAEQEAGI